MTVQASWDLFDRNQIQQSVSFNIYSKGLKLYNRRQVTIKELTPTVASMQVTDRSRIYNINLELGGDGTLYGSCSCSKARQGYVCVHEVAVVISAHENLHKEREEEKPTPSWRKRLSNGCLLPDLHAKPMLSSCSVCNQVVLLIIPTETSGN